jgi:hypothetical protein
MRLSKGRLCMVLAGLAANLAAAGSDDLTGAQAVNPTNFYQFIKSAEVVMIDCEYNTSKHTK